MDRTAIQLMLTEIRIKIRKVIKLKEEVEKQNKEIMIHEKTILSIKGTLERLTGEPYKKTEKKHTQGITWM